MSSILIVSGAFFGWILCFHYRSLKYCSWRRVRMLGRGMNVTTNISSAPEEQPSLPITLCIVLVVNIDPSAWNRWWMFRLIGGLSITCGSETVFHLIKSSFVILLHSSTFVGTFIFDKLNLLRGLKWCFMVTWRSIW